MLLHIEGDRYCAALTLKNVYGAKSHCVPARLHGREKVKDEFSVIVILVRCDTVKCIF